MATISTTVPALHNVDWTTYCKLRGDPSNDHVRMNYLDGTLTLISPDTIHEEAADLLALAVRGTAAGCELAIKGVRSTTLRRGITPDKGSGKDPDNAFYIGPHVMPMSSFRKLRKTGKAPKAKLDLNVDRAPDLAIEIDHSRNSETSLPIYARLGVPEVWRYEVSEDRLQFFRLDAGEYVEIERSVALPKLTPTLVIEALDQLDAMIGYDEVAYLDQIREWARTLPEPPAEGF